MPTATISSQRTHLQRFFTSLRPSALKGIAKYGIQPEGATFRLVITPSGLLCGMLSGLVTRSSFFAFLGDRSEAALGYSVNDWRLAGEGFGHSEGRILVMAEDSRINGFAWFLAGLGVGALAGILYAPKSGRETRDDLANSAREGTEYLRNRSRQVAEQMGTIVDRGKEQVGDYVDRGREAVDRGRAQWEEFVERGKSLVGEQGSRVAAAVDAGRQAYKAGSSPTASNMTTGTSSPTTSTTGAS